MRIKNLLYTLFGTIALLLIPLVFTLTGSGVDGQGWHWTPSDFVVAFVLIFGTGFLYELIAGRSSSTTFRVSVGIVLLILFALVWIQLAVGIF